MSTAKVTPIREVLAKAESLFATASNADAYKTLVQYMFSTWCGIDEGQLNGLGIRVLDFNGDSVEIGVGLELRASVGISIELTEYTSYIELVVRTPSECADRQVYSVRRLPLLYPYRNVIRNGRQFKSVIKNWLHWAQDQLAVQCETAYTEHLRLVDVRRTIIDTTMELENA